MRYLVEGYKNNTGKLQEGHKIHTKYSEALHEALEFKKSGAYRVILITEDSEGADHIDNAGKFFLHRIIN